MQKELPKNDEMDDEELQDLVCNLYLKFRTLTQRTSLQLASAKDKYEKEYEVDKSRFTKHAKTVRLCIL